jgi:hypothetical protein
VRWLALVALLASGAGALEGQTTADDLAQRGAPGWMMAWSPFAPLADLPQRLPGAMPPPDLLSAPAPRVGLWWTAGVPAAIPFEVADRRSMFRTAGGRAFGPYRRPLDPDDVTAFQTSALAWSPIARSGGAAATVLADREQAGAMPYAATLLPYTSDPFVVTDTTIPVRRRVRARLEGAFAWRVGPVGAGAAVGLEESDERTIDSRFPHLGRTSTPAVRGGVVYTPVAAVRLALYGRWIAGTETMTLVPRTATGLAFLLAGYHDPDSTSVAQLAGFFRRSERAARSAGVAAAGTAMGADWVVFAERAIRHDRHFSVRISNPPTDRWDANGWTFGAAAQRHVGAFLVTAQARHETLRGDGRLADLEGVVYRARENALVLSGELRYAPPGTGWTGAVTGTLSRMHRDRYDFIVEVGTDLVEWTPSAGLAVARDIGRTSLAVGASGALYSAAGSIPDATQMGPVYTRLVASGMTLAATPALPLVATLSLGQRLGVGTTLLLDGSYASLGRRGPELDLSLPPQGRRTAWSVSARVVLGPPG